MKLISDEDLNGAIVRGLFRRKPAIDLIRVQDVPEIFEQDDPLVLDWAAAEGRVLISHDENNMTRYALDRIADGFPMSGLMIVPQWLSIGRAIDELLLVEGASQEDEWIGKVLFLPLR